MKKLLSLLLAALLLSALVPSVMAEPVPQEKITSIQIDVVTPVPNQEVHVLTAADVIVKAGDKILSAADGDYTVTAQWTYDSMADPEPVVMQEHDRFQEGVRYKLELELTLLKEEHSVPDKSAFFVKEDEGAVKSAADAQLQFPSKGKMNVKLAKEYDCNPTNLEAITPELSDILVDGVLSAADVEKEYDGKEVQLTVQVVNKKSNAAYAYQWKKDGKPVEGRTEEVLKLRNVTDTGVWSCDVAAYYPANPDNKTASVSSFNKSVKITPHSIKLILEDAQKNLYDKDPVFTYTILGEAYDDLIGSIERVQGETIGNYPLLLGTLAFPDEVKDNYFISVQQGSLTILETGQTAFAPVSGILNGAQIYGAQNSNFRASATTGALPEGANLIFNRVESDGDKETLSQSSSKAMLKCFTVIAKDKADQAVVLPSHAALQIYIPLTEEEAAAYVKNTMTVKLLVGKTVKDLEAEEVMTGDVKYLSVLLEQFGTVGLFAGEALPPVTVGGDAAQGDAPEGEGDGSTLWLWVMIGALVVIAVGAIVFTVIWTGKNSPVTKPVPPAPTAPKKTAPRAPAKEPASPRKDLCDATRAVPATPKKPASAAAPAEPAPAPKAEAPKAAHAQKESEEITPPAAPKKAKRDPMVFSFEDLEEE